MVKQKSDDQVTYTKQLTEDADYQFEDLPRAMEDRTLERESQYRPENPPDPVR